MALKQKYIEARPEYDMDEGFLEQLRAYQLADIFGKYKLF